MAEEKPNTCLAAQGWVADQRSRWNDLGSLHLADIDLLLDKQLQWIADHSDIESLLQLIPSGNSSVTSKNITDLPPPKVPINKNEEQYQVPIVADGDIVQSTESVPDPAQTEMDPVAESTVHDKPHTEDRLDMHKISLPRTTVEQDDTPNALPDIDHTDLPNNPSIETEEDPKEDRDTHIVTTTATIDEITVVPEPEVHEARVDKIDLKVEQIDHEHHADTVNDSSTHSHQVETSNSLHSIPPPELSSNVKVKIEDKEQDVSDPQVSPNTSQNQVSPVPSALEPLERSKATPAAPLQENIPPTTSVTAEPSKSHYPTASSVSPIYEDDDIDEVILVGDKSSSKRSWPVARRISKMPTAERIKPVKRTLQAPVKPPIPSTHPGFAKKGDDKVAAASAKTAARQPKSLSLKKTISNIPDKAVMPLDEHEESNILWVSSDNSPSDLKDNSKLQSENSGRHSGSKFVTKLLDAYHDKPSAQTKSDNGSPTETLERRLDQVLEEVDRNSLEINNSLCALDENRDYLHAKRERVQPRQRNYMSPTVSRLKRLELQKTNHKLQSKLLAAQATPQSKAHATGKDKYSITNAQSKSSVVLQTSSVPAKHEPTKLQAARKKRLGILNGMNAERLKLVQQRRMIPEKELQGPNPKSSSHVSAKPDVASQRDLVKNTASQSFAKSTLSTQLKTHKPVESASKSYIQNGHPIAKSRISIPSKGRDTSLVQNIPPALSSQQPARSGQATTGLSLENKDIKQDPPAKKDTIYIPDTSSTDKNSQDDDSRPRKRPKLPIPGWAMSPELKKALEDQCTLNPEDIFGKMAPLRIEEIFKSYHKGVA